MYTCLSPCAKFCKLVESSQCPPYLCSNKNRVTENFWKRGYHMCTPRMFLCTWENISWLAKAAAAPSILQQLSYSISNLSFLDFSSLTK